MDNENLDEHSSLSRRGLVKGAAGVAAAGAVTLAASRTPAVAAAVPGSDSAAEARDAAGPDDDGNGNGNGGDLGELVVHVRDARSGEMDVYAGNQHFAVRDPALAARLADAAK